MEGNKVMVGKPTRAPRMELRKKTPTGETVWTLDLMLAEYTRTQKLFGHLIAFAMRLKGETVPAHLEEP